MYKGSTVLIIIGNYNINLKNLKYYYIIQLENIEEESGSCLKNMGIKKIPSNTILNLNELHSHKILDQKIYFLLENQ